MSRWVVVLACVIGAGIAGCSSGKSGGGLSQAKDAGPEADAGSNWGVSACATCIDASCSSEIQECSNDPSCSAHLDCLRACPVGANGDVDPTCEASCPAASGSVGQAAIQALDDCRHTGAGASCTACGGKPDGGDAGGDAGCSRPILCQQCAGSDLSNACYKCEHEKCCDTYAACHNNATCIAYITCIQNCTSGYDKCVSICDAQVPDGGYHDFQAKMACVTARCLAECGGSSQQCQQCTNAHCMNEFLDCQLNDACSHATACLGTCAGSQQCYDSCVAKYPGDEPVLDTFLTCLKANCTNDCS